jgi:hypothetical protein
MGGEPFKEQEHMARRKLSTWSVVVCMALAGCAIEDAEDEVVEEADDAVERAQDAALVGLGCDVVVGVPEAIPGTGVVFSTSVVGVCSTPTSVEVVMRIDRPWWPDQTIARAVGGVAVNQIRPFDLSAQCSVAHGKRVFTEVRLQNQRGSAKYQSTRTYVLCS